MFALRMRTVMFGSRKRIVLVHDHEIGLSSFHLSHCILVCLLLGGDLESSNEPNEHER